MPKLLPLFLLAFLTLTTSCATPKITVHKLAESSQSWNGKNVVYPKIEAKNKAQLSVYEIKLAPQARLAFHCHPVPSVAYVESGAVEVELKDGSKKTFKAGEGENNIIVEVVGTWHKGYNPSPWRTTKLLVFYAGSTALKNTIYFEDGVKGKCE